MQQKLAIRWKQMTFGKKKGVLVDKKVLAVHLCSYGTYSKVKIDQSPPNLGSDKHGFLMETLSSANLAKLGLNPKHLSAAKGKFSLDQMVYLSC